MRPALALLIALFASSCASPLNVAVGPAAWPLRGTPASDASAIHRRPLVVKVANDPGARPQTGIADADLIIELPVEGGLTRLSVVFQSKDPSRVGPVRSARQSDLNYLPTLQAILAHVGASESVTQMVRDAAKSGSFVDIDEFQHADAFERVAGKVAPYNAYTSGSKIRDAAGDAGRARVDVPALQFDALVGKAASKEATSLAIPYTGAGRVTYTFDAAAGAYRRPQRSQATMDAEAKKEVMPDNVVVIKTEVKEIPGTADVTGAPSVDFRSTGTGAVVILREGKRFDGTWTRGGTSDMYRFTDSAGEVIPLKQGLTWIHIVPDDYDLSS